MNKNKRQWFTLLEVLIVTVIIGILAVVLCESYIAISKIAFKVEQEKNISEEALMLTQTLQAIADEAEIDYSKYEDEDLINDLINNEWYTDILYLTWWNWSDSSIYIEWNCPSLWLNWSEVAYSSVNDITCSLVLRQGKNETNLISPAKAIPSDIQFRIIPYNSNESYFDNSDSNIIINNIHQQGFWLFIRLYSPLYQPNNINNVEYPLQLFFNLNA